MRWRFPHFDFAERAMVDGSAVLRPSVQVTGRGPKAVRAIVDSGAPLTIADRRLLLRDLSLDETDLPVVMELSVRVRDRTETVPVVEVELALEQPTGGQRVRWTTTVGLYERWRYPSTLLLGQRGWFDRFPTTIDATHTTVEVGPRPGGSATAIVLLLSGVNLDRLGEREPDVYGTAALDDHVATFTDALGGGFGVEHVQSNRSGDLVEAVHRARGRCAAIAVNPAAFTHYAWALHDALAAFDGPVVEVHLSNPSARESWRHTSVVAPVATGTVAGFGGDGYRLAALAIKDLLAR